VLIETTKSFIRNFFRTHMHPARSPGGALGFGDIITYRSRSLLCPSLPPYSGGIKRCCDPSFCLSVCLSHATSSTMMRFRATVTTEH